MDPIAAARDASSFDESTEYRADHDGERYRFRFVAIGLMMGFAALGLRLADLGLFPPAESGAVVKAAKSVVQPRPDIVDRNGRMLATDIKVASMFADPRRIIDIGDTLDQLTLVLPDLDRKKLQKRLSAKTAFVWIKRGLTPKLQAAIHNLGLPGISFIPEVRRVYPAGRTLSHVVGNVDVDNKGMAGIEKYIDQRNPLRATGFAARVKPAPVKLSIDLRVQHVMRNELQLAMQKFSALAAGAVLLDTRSGEVLGMVSLPDYDPNQPREALLPDRINRITKGVYELGSTFKTFTVAMGLDSGVVGLDGGYDASKPIRVGRFTINDFHGKNRFLTVPEIFIYSSNIGAAKMALDVGLAEHQAFLRSLGLLDRLQTELPESGKPLLPKPWRRVSTMTIAYGQGLSTTPMQMAAAGAALVNGGTLMTPTFLLRSAAEASILGKRVVSEQTSKQMRYLLRLNVKKGTGKRAAVPGYRVGGKTGTAQKVGPNGYEDKKLLNTFLSTFPTDNPRYVLLVMIDEPQGIKETYNFRTAGWNAAPTVANIIRRIGPMLGISPDAGFESAESELLLAAN